MQPSWNRSSIASPTGHLRPFRYHQTSRRLCAMNRSRASVPIATVLRSVRISARVPEKFSSSKAARTPASIRRLSCTSSFRSSRSPTSGGAQCGSITRSTEGPDGVRRFLSPPIDVLAVPDVADFATGAGRCPNAALGGDGCRMTRTPRAARAAPRPRAAGIEFSASGSATTDLGTFSIVCSGSRTCTGSKISVSRLQSQKAPCARVSKASNSSKVPQPRQTIAQRPFEVAPPG